MNSLLGAVGLPTTPCWLGQSRQALMVMIIADTWKTAPFMALLFLAGLQVIPDDIYEAGQGGRGDRVAAVRQITLPLLTPAMLVALDLPHAGRAADLRPAVRAHEGRARDNHVVAHLV